MSDHVLEGEELKQSLRKSAVLRREMIEKYGMIPLSVLRVTRASLSGRMFIYQQERPERHSTNYEKTNEKLERLKKAGYSKKITASQRGTANEMSATIMPAELVEFFIKYYAKEHDLYIDPFFGQGIQMQVARLCRLDYIGYDISAEFFKYADAVRKKIDNASTVIDLYCADSRYPKNIEDNSADFCFTSPPYWDIEYYGSEQEQLGNAQSYQEFLEQMCEVARAWHPKFKKSAFIVINVNDFRRKSVFYPYHSDTITLFSRAGYTLHDTWIIDGLVGGLPKAFAVDFNMKKIAPKVHEYALVFRP